MELIEKIDDRRKEMRADERFLDAKLLKDCKQTIINQQQDIDRLNVKIRAMQTMRLKDFLECENQLQRLWDWMQEEKREPANTKFTSGLLRDIAREIEYLKSEQVELVKYCCKNASIEWLHWFTSDEEAERLIKQFNQMEKNQQSNKGCDVCGRSDKEIGEMTIVCTISACPKF